MQVDSFSKMIFVHIPRTGGSWFGYSWRSHKEDSELQFVANDFLLNRKNGKQIQCGQHGRLTGLLKKFKEIDADISDYKIITLVREPVDRIISSWKWFSLVKDTAKNHGWKTIDNMLDEYESGNIRSNYMPQTFWLCDNGAKFDRIFKFENLLRGFDEIQAHFPDWKPRGRLRRTSTKVKPPITEKQIKRIKLLYKDDINFLSKYYPQLKY
mgnify:CR=1 FL=1|jgi:hypothetical protein|tara:strand:- start:276 stop:908 length:633 start_codon:yes stop_codon:yes gene_type:complete